MAEQLRFFVDKGVKENYDKPDQVRQGARGSGVSEDTARGGGDDSDTGRGE
jgi:hypothetical protein